MFILKHIRIGSAFKVGFVVSGLAALVFGLIALLFQAAFVNLIMGTVNWQLSSNGQTVNPSEVFSLISTGTLCFMYIVGVVFGALWGGIAFALTAFFYNLTARWVGGLELEFFQSAGGLLDEIEAEIYEKRKRS